MYSIRRRAGTDMAQILRPDQARLLMGHDIDSRTMERYYINWAPIVDVSAVN